MESLQFRVRLRPDSYVRSYTNIGLIYNIESRREEVFDSSGAVFLKQIGRTLRTGEEILASLGTLFVGVSRETLQNDLREFISYLYRADFLDIINEDARLLSKEEVVDNSVREPSATDRSLAETSEFLKHFFVENPTIFSFQFYTTELCNERCVHCYVDKESKSGKPLPLERRLALIDELGEIGTLDITFTGGEAMLNKDLPVLISRAKQNDLAVSLLSNLTLMTDELFEGIVNANLALVQTSVYSMNANIHDSITRTPGSLAKTLRMLERLHSAGVRVSIACPILKENQSSFEDVLQYGATNNIPANCDFAIMARENGDISNLIHRADTTSLDHVITKIVSNSAKYRSLLEQNRDGVHDLSLNTCGVGSYMLCVRANGEFIPCPGFGLVVGNAWQQSLHEVWETSQQLIELRKFSRSAWFPKCSSCQATTFCNFCLAKFHNEARWDSGTIPSGYCDIAHINKMVALRYLDSVC